MDNKKTTEAVKNAQREYFKKWRAANKDKVRQYNKNFWEKRALAGTPERAESAECAENAEHKKEEGNQ